MLAAKASLVHGDDFNNEDPRVALARQKVDRAPKFIRDAKLGLQDQLTLTQFDADLPPEILEKVKRGAIETLLQRDRIVSGELGLPEDHPVVSGWPSRAPIA